MEKSYYIPEIEEFHVGFEFELTNMSVGGLVLDFSEDYIEETSLVPVYEKRVLSKEWINSYNPEGALEYIDVMIDFNRVRVKYLDEEDVIELGMEKVERGFVKYLPDGTYFHLYFRENRRVKIHHQLTSGLYPVFRGVVKNKSELKRVLKMIEV